MDVMKERFNERLLCVMQSKRENSGFLSKEKYRQIIEKIRECKTKTSGRKPEDYQRLKRYDIMKVGANEKLIFPVSDITSTLRYYVQFEEIFDIIHKAHLAIGHGGRTRMVKELHKSYKNITSEQILIYLSLCEKCQKKCNNPKKEIVVQPTVFKENSRCQIDFIDMQNKPDHEYTFILIYQDFLTKFVQLRPLRSKDADEIAHVLIDIFTIFGAPSVLQSNIGPELCNQVIEETCAMWDELKIVHENRKQHFSSDWLEESPNQDIDNMLHAWLDSNETSHWADGLRFVQFMKNHAYHDAINCSPFEAIFGSTGKIGLNTLSLPIKVIDRANLVELEEFTDTSLAFAHSRQVNLAEHEAQHKYSVTESEKVLKKKEEVTNKLEDRYIKLETS